MVRNSAELQVLSADLTGLINLLTSEGVQLQNVIFQNEITANITVKYSQLRKLCVLLDKQSVDYKIKKRNSLPILRTRFLARPVFGFVIIMIFVLTLVIPGEVLFIRVEGNTSIPTNEIITHAESCGITFGASTAEIRSEQVKNALLEKLNSLQWAAVNTKGCVATISVKEKDDQEQRNAMTEQGSSIVAARDGVLIDVITRSGQAKCSAGQAVKAGQVLISGFVDCGSVLKVCQADGEVIAQTVHAAQIIAPTDFAVREALIQTIKRYSLRIGKKLIKLYQDSGISPAACVKIYEEKPLVLSENNHLPVVLIEETLRFYEPTDATVPGVCSHTWLIAFARGYICEQMIAGTVKNEELSFTCTQFSCKIKGSYLCEEMIGRTVNNKK